MTTKESPGMQLYLVRHGVATGRGALGVEDDADRELTADGVKKMHRCAQAMVKLGVTFDQIWTSPLARARQTAEVLAEELGLANAVRVVNVLKPGGDVDALLVRLQKHLDLNAVALVGHEPDLGELATYLLAGQKVGAVRFKKGGVACLEVEDFRPPIRGELLWLLTPRQTARMA